MLVVSDRTVIDSQRQEALFDFQRTSGVIATITNKDGNKNVKLAEALSGDKKIVVYIVPTFPFAIAAGDRPDSQVHKRALHQREAGVRV